MTKIPRRGLPIVALITLTLALGGCVATMKMLHLATFNEVLLGVQKNDANKVREAAREGVVFDDGEKAIDSSNICGERPLHLAIQKGNLEIVNILLQEGADPDLPSELPREASMCESMNILGTPTGYPALHYAIWSSKPKFAEAILFEGADVTAKTTDGSGALALVGEKTGFELLSAYLESPAHLAARTGDIGALRTLIDNGVDPGAMMATTGRTLLDEALLASHYFNVDYLLANNGAISGVRTPAITDAIEEYLLQNTGSAHVATLRKLLAEQ